MDVFVIFYFGDVCLISSVVFQGGCYGSNYCINGNTKVTQIELLIMFEICCLQGANIGTCAAIPSLAHLGLRKLKVHVMRWGRQLWTI